mgnify:CR=1 FL=1
MMERVQIPFLKTLLYPNLKIWIKDMDEPSVLGAFLHDVGHLVGLVNKMEVMFASDGKALGTKRWSTLF